MKMKSNSDHVVAGFMLLAGLLLTLISMTIGVKTFAGTLLGIIGLAINLLIASSLLATSGGKKK